MTDEVGQHLRISLTVWMMGALLSAVILVTAFSLLVYNNYTGKYSDAMVQATASALYSLSAQPSVTCPQAYASITASISEVDQVLVSLNGEGTNVVYYDYLDGSEDKLVGLMTGINATKSVRLEIKNSDRARGLVVVVLTEVVR